MSKRRFLVLVAVLVTGIGVSYAFGVLGNPFAIVGYRPPKQSLDRFPMEITGETTWTGEDRELPKKALSIARMNEYINRWYRSKDGRGIQLFISYYGNVSAGLDSIYHNPTICFPAQGWNEVESNAERVAVAEYGDEPIPVTVYRFRKGIRERIVLNFFIMNGRVLEKTPREDPLEIARGKLSLGSGPGYYVQVQVVAELKPGDERSSSAASDFLTAAGRHIFPLF